MMPRFLSVLLLLLAWAACTAAEGAQQEENVLRIWPEKSVVKYGDSLVLNCSSNCENIGLETSLQAVAAGTGPTWKAFNLTSVTAWEPKPLCFANCGGTEPKYQRITPTVYRAPERIVLDPLPEVEVGKEYNVTCRVFDVAPIRNLTVTLFKGGERLHVETFEDHRNPEADNVVVTSNSITAQQNDHGKEVTCHAALDLRPEGPFLEKASPSKLLQTVVFPMEPYIQTLGPVEINTSMPVECEVSGLFPVQKAAIQLFFAGERLNSSNHISGHKVSAQAQVSSTSAGEHQLICTVSLGPLTKTAEITVNVYSLPKPTLHIDHPQIPVNTNVTVMCRSDGSKSPGVVMRISDIKEILLSGVGPSLQYSLTAHKEDNGRQFMCKVELKVDGRSVVKETSANLTVFYAPQMSDSSCPDKLTWKDGNEETFICSASGNPPPTVECRKDAVSYNIGIQQQVTKEHGGIYHCNATNAYGFDVRDVIIHVESYQLDTLGIILGILCAAVISSAVGVAYYMYYRKEKIRKYHLRRRQLQVTGSPMEQKCLNGNA
ncbi:intercellular adhesion molecule 5 [Zootoca vivipara]|uniref:intercellular adhesion molecule 5 n=1 Tax=Zootoca vivipara TaxID=8524 RepID=UPI0015923301|nr:intercellular adhesion molecule 5 [Zootoca vivipara]